MLDKSEVIAMEINRSRANKSNGTCCWTAVGAEEGKAAASLSSPP